MSFSGVSRRGSVLVAGAVVLILAGCSSVHRDTGFSGKSNEAFVLLAADGMPVDVGETFAFAFQRVDLKKGKRLDDYFTIFFDAMALGGDEFAKPNELKTLTRFGGRVAPAGDYALIGRVDTASYGIITKRTRNCFSRDAAVLHLEPGRIAVVAAGNVQERRPINAAMLPLQVREVLGGYPNMTAPVVMSAPTGAVAFQTINTFVGPEVCLMQDGFSFTPRIGRGREIVASTAP